MCSHCSVVHLDRITLLFELGKEKSQPADQEISLGISVHSTLYCVQYAEISRQWREGEGRD